MKKNIIIRNLLKALILVALILIIIRLVLWYYFEDINRIKSGEYIKSVDSPNNEYTLKEYCNNGGATTAFAYLVTCRNNDSGKVRNIFWYYDSKGAYDNHYGLKIEWLNNSIVKIGNIKVNADKGTYDWRVNKNDSMKITFVFLIIYCIISLVFCFIYIRIKQKNNLSKH